MSPEEPEEIELDDAGLGIGGAAVTPGPDALFHALSARIRRQTLFYLLEDPEATIDELTDVVAGWRSTESGVVGPDEGEQIGIELRHAHLPLLTNAGLVKYDSAAGTVRLADLSDSVCKMIRLARQYERAVESTG
jgi:DNA-binding transcriptional ArsR family regulator